ncbi:MAG: 2-C-methyl-D-erythritol 4-phosphate cytidylyltransferase [Clostridiaceae bacterium]|nr:2-C-methyl-D-erythritol 4-phosphate cytidylyltransferase [Clostridiaceae bacterium]
MKKQSGAAGAIIVAAGKGSRMGLGYNKLLAEICGKPVIAWTVENFVMSSLIDKIILVVNPDEKVVFKKIIEPYTAVTDITLVKGGSTRQDSVYNGLQDLRDSVDVVLVHDGARPFADKALIERSIVCAQKFGAACAGMPVKDTIKRVDEENIIVETPVRASLWSAQTPQAFKTDILVKAYEDAYQKGLTGTDDASLVEAAGYNVKMFEGSYNNIKLTSPEDLILAEQLMKKSGKVE